MRPGLVLVPLAVVLAAALPPVPARSQDVPPSGSDFGGIGLIETRNARFNPDGMVEAGAALRHQRRFWFLSFQALPFLETTFRLAERLDGTTGAGMTTDRAFDLKLRLVEESDWRPAVAIGLQDMVGTGIHGGEYIVASKRWHDFDVSLGLGWGRLGTGGELNNPLGALSDRFDRRPREIGRGGTLGQGFFRGEDTAVFGGVEWTIPPIVTPWGVLEGLRAKVEYSGDALRDERGGYPARLTGLRGEAASRVNAGLQWRNGWMDVGLQAVHGTDLLFRLSFRADPADPPALPRPALPPLAARRPAAVTEDAGLAREAFAALAAAGFTPIGFGLAGTEARIAVQGGRERTLAATVTRALRAVQPLLPAQVEMIRLSWWQLGAETAEVLVPRRSLEAVARREASAEEAFADTTLLPPDGVLPEGTIRGPATGFDWALEPRLAVILGDPGRTLRWQGAMALTGRLQLPAGFALAGAVQQRVIGNLQGGLPSDSVLPHVRSDYAAYAKEGRTSIPALYAERIWTVAPDLFARATLGYLEPMFGGVAAEVLYRPQARGWAVGLDLNWAKQREFEQGFGLRDYAVATGHLSLYAELPVWNLYAVLRGGRYLAGDWGGTLELGRRFESGIEIGGFATLTEVPFSRFGEGSFDKGIYLRLPLAIFGADNAGVGQALIRPVQRDGGQRLVVDHPLWDVTREGRGDALRRGIGGYLR
jgi:hypothetical protein